MYLKYTDNNLLIIRLLSKINIYFHNLWEIIITMIIIKLEKFPTSSFINLLLDKEKFSRIKELDNNKKDTHCKEWLKDYFIKFYQSLQRSKVNYSLIKPLTDLIIKICDKYSDATYSTITLNLINTLNTNIDDFDLKLFSNTLFTN